MKYTILCLAMLTASTSAMAAKAPLLPAGNTDQVPRGVVAAPPPKDTSEREPVQFSWALNPRETISQPTPITAESREYWQTVDAAELRRGVGISTTAPGAVIRVSPTQGAAQVDVRSLRVNGGGRPVALAQRTNASQLQAAGMAVGDGVAAVQLAAGIPAGRYNVQLPDARGKYVVHVYEPKSDVRLFAALGHSRALAGGDNTLVVNLQDGKRRMGNLQAGGLLVSPSGKSWPLEMRTGKDGMLHAAVPVPRDAGSEPGLWEVQVFAGNGDVQRDIRTAFAVAQPTARLAGDYAMNVPKLQVRLPLQVGAAGRYEARGTLYATSPKGLLQPVSIAHSANWLKPGKRRLVLAFNRDHLPVGYSAPFELRDLELNDQSRMAPIERRERAARIAGP